MPLYLFLAALRLEHSSHGIKLQPASVFPFQPVISSDIAHHYWRGRAPPPMIDDNDSRKVIRFREEIKCIDISPDESGLGSEDQLRTLHEIMGSNQSVWTSNIEDIEMATFKWTFLMQ